MVRAARLSARFPPRSVAIRAPHAPSSPHHPADDTASTWAGRGGRGGRGAAGAGAVRQVERGRRLPAVLQGARASPRVCPASTRRVPCPGGLLCGWAHHPAAAGGRPARLRVGSGGERRSAAAPGAGACMDLNPPARRPGGGGPSLPRAAAPHAAQWCVAPCSRVVAGDSTSRGCVALCWRWHAICLYRGASCRT
jgi:hypothetical protein